MPCILVYFAQKALEVVLENTVSGQSLSQYLSDEIPVSMEGLGVYTAYLEAQGK